MTRIAEIGFAGFETTIACLPLDDPATFAETSARANGLVLCGAHATGAWWDPASAADIAPLVAQASRLPALGCRRLVVSMQHLPSPQTDDHLRHTAALLSQLGRACRAAGDVQLVFHNHAAELADDARVIAAIVDRCLPEDVSLGPDLGWVAHAGLDVPAFLHRFAARIAYLHLRDVTTPGPLGAFLEVGRGTLPYPDILRALAAANFDGWLVAESELGDTWRGLTDPEETIRAQLQGLQWVTGVSQA